jgi:colicin import membrane protein
MKYLRPLLFMVAVSGLPSAFAIDAAQERAERERIKSERAQAEAAFASREKACRERFVVTSCVEDARRDRRQALERLRLQQEVMDQAQRKQRAAERMEDIRNKVSDNDARQRDATAPDPRREKKPAEMPARASSTREAPGHGAAASAPPAGEEAARRRADYDKRQQEAKAHREAVERRNAERAAKGKVPAKPLPVPGMPAASGVSATR